ncbi:MAG TPA: hypothetical protein VGM87_26030 [Roseomonas sp.]
MRRILLAAGLALGMATPAFAQCDTRFTLVNRSGSQVNEFYFGPSSNPNWGQDRLGQDVLPNGRQIMFDTGRPGPHDFRVVWASGEHAEVMSVNICVMSTLTATPRGIEAR